MNTENILYKGLEISEGKPIKIFERNGLNKKKLCIVTLASFLLIIYVLLKHIIRMVFG